MTIGQELKEVYASVKSSVILHTLALSHPSFDDIIYLVRDFQDFTAILETGVEVTFQKAAFAVGMPKKDVNGAQSLSLTIDNTGLVVSSELEQALQFPDVPIKVLYRIYLHDVPAYPQNDPPLEMYLTNAKVSLDKVEAQATMPAFVNRAFPSVNYSGTVFKGLTYV